MEAAKKYFGWFLPTPGGTYTLAHSEKEFNQELWDEFSRIVSIVADLRPFVTDYLALVNDFEVLQGVVPTIEAEIEGTPHILMFTGVPQTRALSHAQGALSNFLGATSSFKERGATSIRERYESGSLEAVKFKAATSDAYDASFAYRLFHNLRNFAQHHALPISAIPVQATRAEDGTHKASVRLILRPQELLGSHLIQKTFREKELVHQTGELELLGLAKETFDYHGAIFKVVIDMHAERLTEMQDYARVIFEKMKVPKGAVPVLWEGTTQPAKHHHFSFDELGLLVKLYERLTEVGIVLGPQPPPAS